MILEATGSLKHVDRPLRLAEVPVPVPRSDELLVEVAACGVCHTELDEIEGRLQPARLPIILGHEVIGRVAQCGSDVSNFQLGNRVGVGWIHQSNGTCQENLAPEFVATGCDVDGGYAEYMTVPAGYAVPIPDDLKDAEAAPLMCAGAIGYRALRLCELTDGQPLGLMGFGGSAHLVLQLAKHIYPNSPVFVFTRDSSIQHFARDLGADWSGAIDAQPPEKVRSIIDTTPAWWPVVQSLRKIKPGGRLVINAIRKEDNDKEALQDLSYHEHLWMEREIKSVANLTFRDIAEFIPLAAIIPIRPEVTTYPLEQANEALQDLRQGTVKGAKVLMIESKAR
tara:strand:- start:102950 stop:103963 length:1014 start_codon:yes stop_codon:yes gene_type:complete